MFDENGNVKPQLRCEWRESSSTDGATGNERPIGAPSAASYVRLRDVIRKRERCPRAPPRQTKSNPIAYKASPASKNTVKAIDRTEKKLIRLGTSYAGGICKLWFSSRTGADKIESKRRKFGWSDWGQTGGRFFKVGKALRKTVRLWSIDRENAIKNGQNLSFLPVFVAEQW